MSSLLLGVLLGLAYFRALWREVARGERRFLLRSSVLLAALAVAGGVGLSLPVVALGLVAGRQLVLREVRRWS